MSNIISVLGTYVRNLHLSLKEWAGIAVAALIGALVTALKVQGSQLHKAQVKILDLTRKPVEDAAAAVVTSSQDRYQDALDAYLKAGGILLIGLLLSCSTAYAAAPSCPEVLKDCDTLVKAQKEQIRVLEDSNKLWRKMATSSSEHNAAPVVVTSTVSGAVAGGIFGAALGLGLGAVVGVTVGIILDEVF